MSLPTRLPMKRLLAAIGGIAFAAVAVTAATGATNSGAASDAAPSTGPQVGAPAPAFTAVDTRGASHSLAAYRGRWVVLEWVNHECPYTKKHYAEVDGRHLDSTPGVNAAAPT